MMSSTKQSSDQLLAKCCFHVIGMEEIRQTFGSGHYLGINADNAFISNRTEKHLIRRRELLRITQIALAVLFMKTSNSQKAF